MFDKCAERLQGFRLALLTAKEKDTNVRSLHCDSLQNGMASLHQLLGLLCRRNMDSRYMCPLLVT